MRLSKLLFINFKRNVHKQNWKGMSSIQPDNKPRLKLHFFSSEAKTCGQQCGKSTLAQWRSSPTSDLLSTLSQHTLHGTHHLHQETEVLQNQITRAQHQEKHLQYKLMSTIHPVEEEVNRVQSRLHQATQNSQQIFNKVQDYMGLLAKCNQPMHGLRTCITQLNVDIAILINPIEQQAKYDQVQAMDNKLYALQEASHQVRKALIYF